jgi:hypothetical protein
LDELGELIRALERHFSAEPHTIIKFEYGNESTQFANVEEARGAAFLPDKVSEARVHIFVLGEGPSVVVDSDALFGRTYVEATSQDQAWNAGATELALDFARRHKYWYGRWRLVAVAPIVGMFSVILIPAAYRLGLSPSVMSGVAVVTGALSAAAGFWLAPRIVPGTQVVIRRKAQSFLKQFAPELTLALSLVAVLIATLSWLFPHASR